MTVLLGNGDGTFQAGISTASQEYPQGIAIADINLDGKPDVVLGGSPNMYVMDGNGDGTFNTTTAGNIYLGVSASDLQITDLTGAALPDLLFISAGNGSALSVEVFVGAQPYVAALAATTTTLQASSASITAGQSVTFTATVAGSSGSTGVPTGTVTFLNGTTTLGTGTLNGSGVATYTTMALGAGTNSITAAYGGDSNFAASTSTAVTVTVQAVPPSFTVSASPTSLSITAGGAGTTTISVTPAGGFAQAVSFACSGLPSEATCTFAPATVTPGASAVTSTLTISTTAAQAAERGRLYRSGMTGLLGLLSMFLFALPRNKRPAAWGRWCALVIAVTLAGGLIACGGGGGSGGGSTPTDPGTPAGTSTVTVTATSGSINQTASLQVTVQ